MPKLVTSPAAPIAGEENAGGAPALRTADSTRDIGGETGSIDLAETASPGGDDTTALLNLWTRGDAEAGERLMERIYPDLLRLAVRHRWDLDLTAQASDLAQDLFVRMSRQRRVTWADRAHFFAVAAKMIRRIIVDHLKERHRSKRGGRAQRLGLEDVELSASVDFDLIALDQALERLARASPSAVQVVELRYFAGLNVDETAKVLEIGRATVIRRWRFARAWLRRALGEGEGD